jgi:hypothetical protein
VCLTIAVFGALASLLRVSEGDASTWAVAVAGEGGRLTPAGWWCLLISLPTFWFLLLRGLWRHHVWSVLLYRLARLEFRLVASHPDGKGGLAFIADYPNAYAIFIFGVSCAVAAALAHNDSHSALSATTFSSIAGAWLAIVLALFAFPLFSFSRPLAELRERALVHWSAEATRYHRLDDDAFGAGRDRRVDAHDCSVGVEIDVLRCELYAELFGFRLGAGDFVNEPGVIAVFVDVKVVGRLGGHSRGGAKGGRKRQHADDLVRHNFLLRSILCCLTATMRTNKGVAAVSNSQRASNRLLGEALCDLCIAYEQS